MRTIIFTSVGLAVLAACGAPAAKPGDATAAAAGAAEWVRPAANPERNVYFGDLHIHTRSSFDAYIFNVRRTADDAYRFAKGETITHPSGFDMTISGGPLDFYAVTDHAEYLGILPAMDTPGTKVSEYPAAKTMFNTDATSPEGRARITDAFQTIGATVRSGEEIKEIYDETVINSVWAENIAAAETHYQPGKFTTFAAYEYTAVTSPQPAGRLRRR